MNNIATFLTSAAGAFIGGCIGSCVVTRWQFARIRELENDIAQIQRTLAQIIYEVRKRGERLI